MGLVEETLDALGAGTITAKQAAKRLMDGDPLPDPATLRDAIETARASRTITEDDYAVLRNADAAGLFRRKYRPTWPPAQWQLDFEERIKREEAEDRRTPEEPGKRRDIRTYPGFASGGVTPREWSQP